MSGYTKIPNWLFDEIMPKCGNASEWLIVCVIARKTFGWGKKSDVISYSQLKKASGIGSRATIKKSLFSLIDSGIIIREQSEGQGIAYSITEPVQKLNQYTNCTSTSTVSEPVPVQKLYSQKKLSKEKKETYIDALPDVESPAVTTIRMALAKICKTTYWVKTEDEYSSAIYALIGMDATAEQVEGFADWWMVNGHYTGKPALKSIMTNWVSYTSGGETAAAGASVQIDDQVGGYYG